jgi:hypothetical protein
VAHNTSSAEREIREAVIARFRELLPGARIVHELNVDGQGSNRVDLAAITSDRLILCEIKSEKDTIERIAEQVHAFGPCCHALVVAAHEKWFDSPGKLKGVTRRKREHLVKNEDGTYRTEVGIVEHEWETAARSPLEAELHRFPHWSVIEWRYPCPDELSWRFDRYRYEVITPWPAIMLRMLWRDELFRIASHAHLNPGNRATRTDLMRWILNTLHGVAIEKAVCEALRRRDFAEADPPLRGDCSEVAALPDRKAPARPLA